MKQNRSAEPRSAEPAGALNEESLRRFLLTRSVAWLVDELMALAQATPVLRARLAQAAGAQPDVDVSGFLHRLDRAAEIDDYVHYREAYSFADGIRTELAAVDELRAAGFAAAALEVVEHGITVLEEACQYVDDSDGEVGAVLADAQQLHAELCIDAAPDPLELAERLAAWALRSDCEVFLDSPSSHAGALGEAGLARFREVLESDDQDSGRFVVRHLREQLAAQRGTDTLVGVLAEDLSSAYQFYRIATLLAGENRIDEALGWLDRGMSMSFGTSRDTRLDDLAADLHRRAGRFEAATELVAAGFAGNPSVAGYERLKMFAIDSGDWPTRRAAAIQILLALPVARAPKVEGPTYIEADGHGILVQVLLAEGDIDQAWAAAHQGGCRGEVWTQIAQARGVRHPADAVPVFQRLGIRELDGGNRTAYARGASLIHQAHIFAAAADLADASTNWILDIRELNRRRPALQNEFDLHKLPRRR